MRRNLANQVLGTQWYGELNYPMNTPCFSLDSFMIGVWYVILHRTNQAHFNNTKTGIPLKTDSEWFAYCILLTGNAYTTAGVEFCPPWTTPYMPRIVPMNKVYTIIRYHCNWAICKKKQLIYQKRVCCMLIYSTCTPVSIRKKKSIYDFGIIHVLYVCTADIGL